MLLFAFTATAVRQLAHPDGHGGRQSPVPTAALKGEGYGGAEAAVRVARRITSGLVRSGRLIALSVPNTLYGYPAAFREVR